MPAANGNCPSDLSPQHLPCCLVPTSPGTFILIWVRQGFAYKRVTWEVTPGSPGEGVER